MVKTIKIINNRRGEVPSPFDVSPDIKVSPVHGKSGTEKNKGGETPPLQKDLPEGWQIVSLAEITEINPKIDKSQIADDTKVSFVPMQAVGAGDGRIDTSIKKRFAEVKKGYTPFRPRDVLFAKITPCMENGKIAVVPALHNNLGFGSTEFHVIRSKERIDPRYIYYYISRLDYRKEAASKMTGAVGQKRVSTDFIKSSTIPLAPLDQQKLIVAEIEKQFSRLDEAVGALRRIQANLKRYKASVLKAAVEGKLTEQWRSRKGEQPFASTKDETGADLLKRILAERRKKWEEDHVKKYVGAHGHAPTDDLW
jgi:type I restriction enzyme S subunit